MGATLSQMAGGVYTEMIGGKEYTFSPITLSDMAYMMDWFVNQPMQTAKAHLLEYGDMYDAKEKRRIVAKAKTEYDERQRAYSRMEQDEEVISRVSTEMNTALSSYDGTALVLWLSLRKHSSITRQEAGDLVTIQGVEETQAIIDMLSTAPEPVIPGVDDTDDEKKT